MLNRKLKLYLPFLALIVAQAVFVAVAPSDAPGEAQAFTGPDFSDGFTGDGDGSGGFTGVDPVTGEPLVDEDGNPIDPASDPSTTGGSTSSGATADGATGGPTGGSQPGPGGGAAVQAGDTSHCVGDSQFDLLLNNPACKPRFTGDNGGATATGVTRDTIKIVQWEFVANEASDSILATQGLATTPEDRRALDRAATSFIEKHYELYGRKLEVVRVPTNCRTSPQDVATCTQEARRIIAMKPFMVIIGGVNYPEIYDEFARAGVIALGGWHWPTSYFEGRRPFRYDLFMDGDQSSTMLAEYYCKKLAGKKATNAGINIHPQIGGRSTTRRVGILAPDRDTDELVAKDMAARLNKCGARSVVQLYSPDINEASGQARTQVQRFIAEKVTTVVCFCDPVVPVYLFRAMTQQAYYPEHLLSGTGLLDYDKLGRLYDQDQWIHAFGPGHLFSPLPFDQQDVSRMWRASGEPGKPCQACNLNWSYYALAAGGLHNAGPNLTPTSFERGLLTAKPYGGDRPGSVLVKFGPRDYTVISDAREVYWDPARISQIDGQPGAYVTLNGGTRYEIGEWTNEFKIPAAPK